MPASDNRAGSGKLRAGRLPTPNMDWAYFFDIDGTLVNITPRPDGVRVDEELAELVTRLHVATGGAVALISGRSIADVDRIFRIPGMPAAGQHGLERRDARGRVISHDFPIGDLERVRRFLADAAEPHDGLLVEYKGLSVALHYRLAPALGGYANRLAREAQRTLAPEFAILRGKRVVELKPAGRDKGIAVREFMEEPPFAGRVPVFLGDDATDEFAIKVVNQMKGHSIKVGTGRTSARWRIASVAGVRSWLRRGISMGATAHGTNSLKRRAS